MNVLREFLIKNRITIGGDHTGAYMDAYIGVNIFVFGLIIGSFLNVCIWRLPREESVIGGHSHCVHCGKRIRAKDLIPLFSYLFLRGKCRDCGKRISARYALVEFITGLSFVILFLKLGLCFDLFSMMYLVSILIVVLFVDIDHRIIPDELVIAGLIGGAIVFVYNIFAGIYTETLPPVLTYGNDTFWWNPILGLIIGSGSLFLVAVLGSLIYKTDDAMGGGDIKIYAPIGLFLGWKLTLVSLFFSVIIGGVIGIILLLVFKVGRKAAIPFGPFIVIGTYVTILWGWDFLIWYFGRYIPIIL